MKKIEDRASIIYRPEVADYNVAPPFNPPEVFPEFSASPGPLDPENRIYAMVRDSLRELGMDSENFGSPAWNPLREYVKPGFSVLVKPNLVKHYHPDGDETVLATITHGSVLRPILDYIRLALRGVGEITVADMPLDKSDFDRIVEMNGLRETVDFLNSAGGPGINLLDFRRYRLSSAPVDGGNLKPGDDKKIVGRFLLKEIPLPGDPKGYRHINLGGESAFSELDDKERIYYTLADFDVDRFNPNSRQVCSTNKFHGPGKHIYKIPGTVLEADAVICVAKLKTHKIAGVTLGLKNMIGICDKIYMPHYRPGHPPEGDASEFPADNLEVLQRNAERKVKALTTRKKWLAKILFNFPLRNIYRVLKTVKGKIQSERMTSTAWWGTWIGNDTLWRTIVDLNRIMLFADRDGGFTSEQQRGYLCIIDGIVGQEGEGPMTGTAKPLGVVVAAESPNACDTVCAHIMGFSPEKIPLIRNAAGYNLGTGSPGDVAVFTDNDWESLDFRMIPPTGYKGIVRE